MKDKTPYSEAYKRKYYTKKEVGTPNLIKKENLVVPKEKPIKEIHNIFPKKRNIRLERKIFAQKLKNEKKSRKKALKEAKKEARMIARENKRELKESIKQVKKKEKLVKERRKKKEKLFKEKIKTELAEEKMKRILLEEKIRKKLAQEKSRNRPKEENFVEEARDVLTSKKALKIEKYVVFLFYLLVFLGAGYFLLINTNPNAIPNSFYNYELSASDSMISSSLRSLYLKDPTALGGIAEINNESARMIVSEKPFNFVFNPKRKIGENASANIQLSFIKSNTEIYLNDELIIPNLDGFERVTNFSNKEIWVRENMIKPFYIKENNTEDFIYANFPGKSIYSFEKIKGGAPIIPDYTKEETSINKYGRFRGNLKLAVYAEGDLNINFVKQDLNWYIGKDEYTVKITDPQGNVYLNETYWDDGDKKDSGKGDFKQNIDVRGKNLPKNIYYVTFTRDKNNKAADSTIGNIKINSNKVLIVGKSLPLREFNFYTEVGTPEKIGFYYWHNRKNQKIKVTGTKNMTIDLNESWKGKRYEEELTRGQYSFEASKGDLWIYSNAISPSKESWFYLPKEGEDKMINQDVIVLNRNKLKIDGDDMVYNGTIAIHEGEKIRVQVLDGLKTYFKNIKLVI